MGAFAADMDDERYDSEASKYAQVHISKSECQRSGESVEDFFRRQYEETKQRVKSGQMTKSEKKNFNMLVASIKGRIRKDKTPNGAMPEENWVVLLKWRKVDGRWVCTSESLAINKQTRYVVCSRFNHSQHRFNPWTSTWEVGTIIESINSTVPPI